MGILNCACMCNGDIDFILNKEILNTEDTVIFVIMIQKNFRGFLARKELKEILHQKRNITYGVKFQKEWDITTNLKNFKLPQGFEYSINNLINTKQQILKFYKSDFFNHSIKNDTKTNYTIKESLYKIETSDQFLSNFKILILNYLQESFDLGSKEKLMLNIVIDYDKEEEPLLEKLIIIEKEGSSLNSTSLKNFTFNSNVDSSNKDNGFKDRESPSNQSVKNRFTLAYELSKNKGQYKKLSEMEIKNSSSIDYNQEFKINLLTNFIKKEKLEGDQTNRNSINLLKKKNAILTPKRNVLLQRSIDKNNDYIRAATKGSSGSKRLPFRINTGAEFFNSKNNSNFIFSPRFDMYTVTSLWGQNDKPTIENIIEDINKNTKNQSNYILMDNDEGTYYEGAVFGKQCYKYGIGVQYLIDKSKGFRYKYLGYFKDNKFHGYGIFSREDGYHYRGEFRAGKKCGYGFEVTDKWTYSGFFHNDKPHGYGEAHYFNKLKYFGCFNNGIKEHIGYVEYEDNSRYIGHFLLNKMFSIGMFIWPAGHIYYGEWKDDKMSGKGKYRWKNGDIYFGGYENDLRHGEGEYFFAERNSLLRGYWVNGQKNGRFKLIENGESHIINYSKDKQVSTQN